MLPGKVKVDLNANNQYNRQITTSFGSCFKQINNKISLMALMKFKRRKGS